MKRLINYLVIMVLLLVSLPQTTAIARAKPLREQLLSGITGSRKQYVLQATCPPSVVVANTNDSGPGSLRQALVDLCANGTATFDPSLSGTTITLSSQLTLDKNVTIDGSALPFKITISGNNLTRVFFVPSGSTVTLKSLIIAHGNADTGGTDDGNNGGGIHNAGGTLTVENCLLIANHSGYLGGAITNIGGGLTVRYSAFSSNNSRVGGAMFNGASSTLTVINSTLSQNTASTGGGGGIYNEVGTLNLFGSTLVDNAAQPYYGGGIFNMMGTVKVANSTFSENSATWMGSAILNFGTLVLNNSTLSGNSNAIALVNSESPARLDLANTIIANTVGALDCVNMNTPSNPIMTNINNLIETTDVSTNGTCRPTSGTQLSSDPVLGALTLIPPGTTPTFPLLVGSPAINAGDNTICGGTLVNGLDQRGVVRPQGASCDIGAYEQKPGDNNVPAFTSTAITSGTQGGLYSYAITTSDPDTGDSLSISAPLKPNWLNLVDNGDGTATLSGTPTNANVGSNSVTLVVADTFGATSSQDFLIDVANTNDPPVFTSTAIITGAQGLLYSYAITTSDPDEGDSVTITASTKPAWLSLVDNSDGTATLSGIPANTDVGDNSVSLVVTDSFAASSPQEFTIEVQGPDSYLIFLPIIQR